MGFPPVWVLAAAVLVVVFIVAAVTGRLEGRTAPMRVVIGMLLIGLALAVLWTATP